MKERIISSLVGLTILAVVIFFHHTILLNLVIVFIAAVATYELLNATDLFSYKPLAIISTGFSVLLPFAQHPFVRPLLPIIIFLFAVLFFVFVITNYSKLQFEKMAMAMLFSIFVPLFISSAVYFRDEFGSAVGLYYLLLALGSAWFCDSGAYFAGYFFGKTRMAPVISPKKTIEGAVGGVIAAILCNLTLAVFYSWFSKSQGEAIQINLLLLAIASPFLALLGMLGDLVASVIKRQYHVKDYGHIMPGHGGVMDRFDSVLLTLPAVYVLVRTYSLAWSILITI